MEHTEAEYTVVEYTTVDADYTASYCTAATVEKTVVVVPQTEVVVALATFSSISVPLPS